MTKRELIEALEKSDAPDDAPVWQGTGCCQAPCTEVLVTKPGKVRDYREILLPGGRATS